VVAGVEGVVLGVGDGEVGVKDDRQDINVSSGGHVGGDGPEGLGMGKQMTVFMEW